MISISLMRGSLRKISLFDYAGNSTGELFRSVVAPISAGDARQIPLSRASCESLRAPNTLQIFPLGEPPGVGAYVHMYLSEWRRDADLTRGRLEGGG